MIQWLGKERIVSSGLLRYHHLADSTRQNANRTFPSSQQSHSRMILSRPSLEIPQASVRNGLICAVGAYSFVERLHARTLEDLGALPMVRRGPEPSRICPLPCSSGIAVGHQMLQNQVMQVKSSAKKMRKEEVARAVPSASYVVTRDSVPRFATLFGATSGRVKGCAVLPEPREPHGGVLGMDYVPPECVAGGDGSIGAFLCGGSSVCFGTQADPECASTTLWSAGADDGGASADEAPARLLAKYSIHGGNRSDNTQGLKYVMGLNHKLIRCRFVKEWNSFIVGTRGGGAAMARHDLTREDEAAMLYDTSGRSVQEVGADPTSKLVFCSCFDHRVRMYAYNQKEVVAEAKLESEGITGMYDPTRHLMIAGATYGKIEFFDSRKFTQRLGVVKAHDCGSVSGMDVVSAKDGLYVSCNSMKPYTISLWNVDKKVLHRFETAYSNRDVRFVPCDSPLDDARLLEEAEERCLFVVGFEFLEHAKVLCQMESRELFLFRSLLV